ncbi:hypothetical protein [Streptomyces sp. NPDC057280]|uniref:hypothetical protein n=1 Tax=Streptomyces sp. NPDC057280 TaxID=3346081 RepID=UPI00363001CA
MDGRQATVSLGSAPAKDATASTSDTVNGPLQQTLAICVEGRAKICRLPWVKQIPIRAIATHLEFEERRRRHPLFRLDLDPCVFGSDAGR